MLLVRNLLLDTFLLFFYYLPSIWLHVLQVLQETQTSTISFSSIRRFFAAAIQCAMASSPPALPNPVCNTEINAPRSSTVTVIVVSSRDSSKEDGSERMYFLYHGYVRRGRVKAELNCARVKDPERACEW